MDSGMIILYMSIALGSTACALIGKWYVFPRLRALPLTEALKPLLLVHTFRYIGMAFLVTPGVVSPQLAPGFALPAAWGDLAVSLLAFLSLLAVSRKWSIAVPLVWFFNVVGMLDLAYAITNGARFGVIDQLQGGAYFIPALAVPMILVSHYMIFKLLGRHHAFSGEHVPSRLEPDPQGVTER